MKILSIEQVELLKSPLPKEAISQHPTKTFLSTIKAIYVVERLNQVFGVGSWNIKSEVIDSKTSMIVVRSTLTIPEYGIELESFGGNNNGGENSKNFDLGDAYKGATTDALTKICSYLEIGIDVFKGLKDKPVAQVKPVVKPVVKVDKRKEKIVSLCKSLGIENEDYKMFVFSTVGSVLKEENFDEIIDKLEIKLEERYNNN